MLKLFILPIVLVTIHAEMYSINTIKKDMIDSKAIMEIVLEMPPNLSYDEIKEGCRHGLEERDIIPDLLPLLGCVTQYKNTHMDAKAFLRKFVDRAINSIYTNNESFDITAQYDNRVPLECENVLAAINTGLIQNIFPAEKHPDELVAYAHQYCQESIAQIQNNGGL